MFLGKCHILVDVGSALEDMAADTGLTLSLRIGNNVRHLWLKAGRCFGEKQQCYSYWKVGARITINQRSMNMYIYLVLVLHGSVGHCPRPSQVLITTNKLQNYPEILSIKFQN